MDTRPDKPRGTRIIVLDDDQDSREMFAEFLRMNGMEVDEFGEPEAALASIADDSPAVIVVDITLSSDLSGYDVARHVRALPTGSQVRLVATTGHSSASVKKEGELFDAILTKPVNLDELIAVVKQLAS